MRNIVLDGLRKILETYYMRHIIWKSLENFTKVKTQKIQMSTSCSYSLFQHIKVTALDVLRDDVKYISKQTFEKNYP